MSNAPGEVVEEERLKAILESLLFAAGGPVTLSQLVSVLDNVPREDIRKALGDLATAYLVGNRGLIIEEVAGGYQLRTARDNAPFVRKLLSAKPLRLSRPLLETLAIIAYRQPITRPEIEQLRGVDSGGVLETLMERHFIKIAGRKEAAGRPIMYATTTDFLEVFGLKDLQSLPDLEEFRALEGSPEGATGENESAEPASDTPSDEDASLATFEGNGASAEDSSEKADAPWSPETVASESGESDASAPEVSDASDEAGDATELAEESGEETRPIPPHSASGEREEDE